MLTLMVKLFRPHMFSVHEDEYMANFHISQSGDEYGPLCLYSFNNALVL